MNNLFILIKLFELLKNKKTNTGEMICVNINKIVNLLF